jgi:DNA-binding response OmpR family regulator
MASPANAHATSALGVAAFIVDDEDPICTFISGNESGLESAIFRAGERAISALQHRQPEGIFLASALGQSDTMHVIRALALQRYRGTIQLISGRRRRGSLERGLSVPRRAGETLPVTCASRIVVRAP